MGFKLWFALGEAFKNLRLNLLMSVTAITTTAVCILVLGVGLLVNAHVEGLIREVGQDVALTAFFPQDASQEQIDKARSAVEGYSEVRESTYVSKEEALRRFRQMIDDQPEISDSIGEDVLPASIEMRLDDPRNSEAVADKLRGEGFEDFLYNQKTIDQINEVTSYIVWGLRGATALFLVASILLIFNTIRLSIFARRKEIEVMKLVGASDELVRTPFVLEGLLQGLIGAGFAAVLVVWANAVFLAWVRQTLPFVPISSDAVNTLLILFVLIAVGVLIGTLGSFLSVRRFLKV